VWGSKNTILDGHNRYALCQKHNLDFDTTEIEPTSESEAKIWIIKNQFGRRNLTPYQRGELIIKLEGIEEGIKEKARENLKTPTGGRSGLTLANSPESKAPIDAREELAKIAGVGSNTMGKIRMLNDKAPEPIKAQLRTGDISINAAHKELKL